MISRVQPTFSSLLRSYPSVPFPPALPARTFSTTEGRLLIRHQTRMRVVDNSAIGQQCMAAGKWAKVFHVYNKRRVGTLGDKVMVAIMGQKKRGYIVGVVRRQMVPGVPTVDTNNLVLIDESGAPLGTRINVPIPMMLRSKKGDIAKILSIATRFV
ncbi:hypothetical protein RvY_18805 [Ramazzottius varieornatus]|uniref:Large ribosomal subunit protein uL14m n=1 Tax=Ramazzottius varieornatus TaxID=947166 RepID=A0A1D1W753_RAMVA|nr:hypothetical protein RvY_18805 [Ramazzottius varieornatus]